MYILIISLINKSIPLTKANPKIANYPFTTLYPNLGVLKTDTSEIVLADIPGLIKGASTGTGLGHDFLRHIDRTKCLIHLISVTNKKRRGDTIYKKKRLNFHFNVKT
mgnify:CR=1 FL=1